MRDERKGRIKDDVTHLSSDQLHGAFRCRGVRKRAEFVFCLFVLFSASVSSSVKQGVWTYLQGFLASRPLEV